MVEGQIHFPTEEVWGEPMAMMFTDIQFTSPKVCWPARTLRCSADGAADVPTWKQQSVGGIAILQVTVPNQGLLYVSPGERIPSSRVQVHFVTTSNAPFLQGYMS